MLFQLNMTWQTILEPVNCDRFLRVMEWGFLQKGGYRLAIDVPTNGIVACLHQGTDDFSFIVRANERLLAISYLDDSIIAIREDPNHAIEMQAA